MKSFISMYKIVINTFINLKIILIILLIIKKILRQRGY